MVVTTGSVGLFVGQPLLVAEVPPEPPVLWRQQFAAADTPSPRMPNHKRGAPVG